jgi:hypothetical protein
MTDDKIDPQKHLRRMWETAPKLAQAKANRVYLEEYRKTLKAQLMKACGADAIGAQEREAYAHPDYEAHLQALREAVQIEETLRWRMVTDQASVDVWRSQEASGRAMDRGTA